MNEKIVAVCLFLIAVVFLYSGFQCVMHGMTFETVLQCVVFALFVIAGFKEWRK